MAAFSVSNSTVPAGTAQIAVGSSYFFLIAVMASSGNTNGGVSTNAAAGLKRGKLYDILVGTNGTPADNFMEYDVCRATIGTTVVWLGSVSSVSSSYMLDQADGGFSALTVINASAGSSTLLTNLAEPWYVGVNQRASYRWVAAPGSEIVYAANSSGTGSNGLALRSRSGGYTGTATGTVMVTEQ